MRSRPDAKRVDLNPDTPQTKDMVERFFRDIWTAKAQDILAKAIRANSRLSSSLSLLAQALA